MARKILSLSLILGFIYVLTTNFSQGDAVFYRYISLYNAIADKNWEQARAIERTLDKKIVKTIKENNYPEYHEVNIQRILSLTNQTADTHLKVANLYLKLGDREKAIEELKVAKSFDPIRQDIRLFLQELLSRPQP